MSDRVVKSWEACERIPDFPKQKKTGEKPKERNGVSYETTLIFGRWTLRMLSSLRAMSCAAQEAQKPDKGFIKRVDKAYYYLYTRALNRRKRRSQ